MRPGMCQAAGVLGLAIACAVSAAAWVYLVAAHGGFWRTGERLPRSSAGGGRLRLTVRTQDGEQVLDADAQVDFYYWAAILRSAGSSW